MSDIVSSEQLRLDIKKMILKAMKIVDVQPEEIGDDVMIFESELLNLDSLDGLELVVAIQKEFGVAINDQSHALTILQSVDSIAEFIEQEKNN